MVDLLELPDVPLRMVIAYLPVWKLGHLTVQCRRLYKLVQSDYQTRRHLSVLGGVLFNKFQYSDDAEIRILNLPDEYDLVIRFEYESNRNKHADFRLSVDLEPHNIPKMLTCLPNITHLTVVVVNEWPSEVVVQMLSAWPRLESLKLVNRSRSYLDWHKIGPVISSMCKLEHFMFYTLTDEFELNREHFDTFIWKGLKTYINNDYPQYKMSAGKKHCKIVDRGIWDKPEHERAVAQFETFGVHHYILSESAITNVELLRKLKRIHISNVENTNILRQVNWTNWTGLQFLALTIEKVNFSQTFSILSVLTNLEDLNLFVVGVHLPKARSCKLWTCLPSVRRFRLVAHLDAHEFYKVANCVPNASNCSLKMRTTINVENDGPDEYFTRRRTMEGPVKVCKKCTAVMKRAIEKYRSEINSFVWFRQIGEDGKELMVPTVRLFTENVAGSTRFNTRYIPIE